MSKCDVIIDEVEENGHRRPNKAISDFLWNFSVNTQIIVEFNILHNHATIITIKLQEIIHHRKS